MTKRNDPCPCGSGKKYKKCCWAKDHRANTKQNVVQQKPELNLAPANDPSPELEIDPLMERINDFWEEFMDAPYEKQWTAVTEMLLNEPELCDGEMVFEIANDLFGKAAAAGEIVRYKRLLDQLQEIVPEAYEEKLHYILDWRIQIGLMEGDESSVERHFRQFSSLAGDQLDIYYQIMSALAYHGKQEILYQGMRQALPYVAEGGDLVAWAYGEFVEKLGNLEILHQLDKNPDLMPDDAILQQHLAEYELATSTEWLSATLDYRTGRKTPAWTLADLEITKGEEKDPARDEFGNLLSAFTHYAHVEAGIARTKVEMAHNELSHYFAMRLEGELNISQESQPRRKKRIQKRKNKHLHPLCPDAKTLDHYLAKSMGFMSFRYYEASALFELVPLWLHFLIQYELLDEETRQETIQTLGYLKDPLIQYADSLTSAVMKENLTDWPHKSPNG